VRPSLSAREPSSQRIHEPEGFSMTSMLGDLNIEGGANELNRQVKFKYRRPNLTSILHPHSPSFIHLHITIDQADHSDDYINIPCSYPSPRHHLDLN
jgi:hypothetical protein